MLLNSQINNRKTILSLIRKRKIIKQKNTTEMTEFQLEYEVIHNVPFHSTKNT